MAAETPATTTPSIPPACKADALDAAQKLRKRIVKQVKEQPAELQGWIMECVKLDLK